MGEDRPRGWRRIEDAFDILLKLVGYGFLAWGVGMFILVLYGVYLVLTGQWPSGPPVP